jgi:NADPH-dependent curcumin reductase CurA
MSQSTRFVSLSLTTACLIAAAGGTGSFAVQLAKQAGCRVIGTCSSAAKVAFLRELGCDRPIDTSTENLHRVLRTEFPKGCAFCHCLRFDVSFPFPHVVFLSESSVDVVYEGVGGAVFDACVSNLAVHGRLIVIGSVSGYQDASTWGASPAGKTDPAAKPTRSPVPIGSQLLAKSASIRGFFVPHFASHFAPHMMQLAAAVQAGTIRSVVDRTRTFVGLESVADAVDHLYSRRNIGKVVVAMPAAGRSARL